MAMDEYAGHASLRVDLVYARADHKENIFKAALYHPAARLWLHRDLAGIVLSAAALINERWDGVLVLKDGLRTIEAQAAMQDTAIVKANPHWLAKGPQRLLSPPGAGGHPRGMAVDVTVAGPDGAAWDMGTPFDYLTTDPAVNPAARDYRDLPVPVLENRARLETAFLVAAAQAGHEILPLPSEWWDFRFPAAVSERFAPLSDANLPPEMRMTVV